MCKAKLPAIPVSIPEAFQIALQHHQSGRLAEAEVLYRQILTVDPRHADALHLLGVIAHQAGRNDLAVELIRQAVALSPNHPPSYSNLGLALSALGQFDDAIVAYRRALQLKPDYFEAYNNLGNTLRATGQIDDAIVAFRRALEIKPDYADVRNNLGNAFRDQGHLDEAIAAYHEALRLKPDYAIAYNNLGQTLEDQGQSDEAIAAYRRALQLDPDLAGAHSNLGNALKDQGRIEEAIAAYHRALQSKPDSAEAHGNLGIALVDQGQLKPAMAAYRRALELRPNFAAAHSNLLLGLHYLPDSDATNLFSEHCRWAEIHARPLAQPAARHGNDRNPERRLRIGYVSPDFREHSVAFFIEGLLAAHDREQVEVFCYADLVREDGVSERLRQSAAHWRRITGQTDAQVSELIRRDAIDILVDLAGHTAHHRLLVFARKPAPVQVTYLGYCDTTGLSVMDYRITDALADPPGATEHLYTEQLVRLPDSMWCYRPPDYSPAVHPPPILRSGYITFGCFNVRPKITDAVLALWVGLLHAVPGSRLLLKNLGFRDASVQQGMRDLLAAAGIPSGRVELAGPVPTMQEHLEYYGRVDIALDTFPYHGTTTTCEALWMGVPVVTLAGRTHAARVGVSLLTTVGLPELVAASPDEYVKIAAALAADVPRLAALRTSLRARMAASPLLDATRFARHVEVAYRQMWRTWCINHASQPSQ